MKAGSVTAVATAAVLLAGCGNSADTPAPRGPVSQASSAAPATRTPTAVDRSPSPTEDQGPARLKIGQTFTGAGWKVTIYSAKFDGQADSEPDKGKVWVPADVKICNATTGESLPTPSWSSWQLKTTDDYHYSPPTSLPNRGSLPCLTPPQSCRKTAFAAGSPSSWIREAGSRRSVSSKTNCSVQARP